MKDTGVEAGWHMEDERFVVTIQAGEAQIVVSHPQNDAEDAVTLINALPQIMDAIMDTIEEEE